MIARDIFMIGGRWEAPTGSGVLDVISPITEAVIGRVPESTNEDMDKAVASARKAFDEGPWPRMSLKERGDYLLQIGEILAQRAEEAIRLQIDEMGAPYSHIQGMTRGTFAGVAHQIEALSAIPTWEVREGPTAKVVVTRTPVGVAAGIIPWNSPVPLVISKMLPALLTGCTIVIKPAPETPLSAYMVAEAAIEAGLPEGVLSLIPGGREVGEHLVTHPGVDRVSFTGSSAAGARIAQVCGDQLKKVTLELGGKSAALVLADADLDRDLPVLIKSAMPNNGQTCYATTRILAPRSRSNELVERLVAAVGSMKVGNPHEADTNFGPLVASRQRDRVEGYIKSGREQGATVALGGGRPADQPIGWYVEPTIFTNVENSMRIAQEEIFGPVVAVIDYNDEEDAVAIANDSEYGLGGAIFTTDVEHGLDIATRIQTGTCRINDGLPGGGGGPFGGVKRSGLGREYGREGFESYFELKSIGLPPGYEPAPRTS
jgi:aldehyde dehydrogenase (NAD+)